MTLQEVILKKPNATAVLLEFGLSCAACGLNSIETIREGALAHGLSESEIDLLIKRINSL